MTRVVVVVVVMAIQLAMAFGERLATGERIFCFRNSFELILCLKYDHTCLEERKEKKKTTTTLNHYLLQACECVCVCVSQMFTWFGPA